MGTSVNGSGSPQFKSPAAPDTPAADSSKPAARSDQVLQQGTKPDSHSSRRSGHASRQHATDNKSSNHIRGKMIQKDLEKILGHQKKTDLGPDIYVITKDIIKTPEEKVQSVIKMLKNADPEDFKKSSLKQQIGRMRAGKSSTMLCSRRQ
jgi:hypothetical protein